MPGKEQSFLLYAKNGQLGLHIDEALLVNAVQKGSMADGKIFIGNKLLRVNNQPISTKAQFDKLVHDKAGQGLTITVWHDKEQIKNLKQPNQDVANAGFAVKELWIVWNPLSQQKLGLTIKGYGSNVFVTRVAENSVCSIYLQEGDRLLEVDGWPVIDQEMCQKFLVQAFRFNNRVGLKVERPVIEDAKSSVSSALSAYSDCEPSVIMQSDVLEIMENQRQKLAANNEKNVKGVYKTDVGAVDPKKSSSLVNTAEEKKQVQIKSEVDQKFIGRDTSEVLPLLRSVPPRTQPSNNGN